MRRGLVAFLAFSLIGLGVTGCGVVRYQQREPWRDQAEAACLSQKQVQPTAYMALAPAIQGPGTCGMNHPFKISAFSDGSVGLSQKVTLACPVIPRIDAWLNEVVQPAALMYFGERIAEIRSGSYSCRGRNNQRGARLSEHSFGNAVDIMSLRLAGGYTIPIERGWRGGEREQEFLREIFVGACRYFTTVLGPGADVFHYNHFHLDLARHDPHGSRHICKPIIKFTPRLAPDGAAVARFTPRTPMPERVRGPEPQFPAEVEEEDDPFAAAPVGAAPVAPHAARTAERGPAAPAYAPSAPRSPPAERSPAAPAYASASPRTPPLERGPEPVALAKKSDRLTAAPLPPSRAGAFADADDDGPEPMRLHPQRAKAGAIY